jgi:hypothetical protein
MMVFSVITAVAGCGGDDEPETSASPAVSTAGGGGTGAGAPVTCGGQVCKPLEAPGLQAPLKACCMDQFTASCGVTVGTACNKVPEAHATCPSLDMSGFGLVFFGCCTANKCGLTGSFLMNECRDLETLRAELDGQMMMGMGMGGGRPPFMINLPEPQACD